MQAQRSNPRWDAGGSATRLPAPWDEILTHHGRCLAALQAGRRVEAYAHMVGEVQPFLKVSATHPALASQPPLSRCCAEQACPPAHGSNNPEVILNLYLYLRS